MSHLDFVGPSSPQGMGPSADPADVDAPSVVGTGSSPHDVECDARLAAVLQLQQVQQKQEVTQLIESHPVTNADTEFRRGLEDLIRDHLQKCVAGVFAGIGGSNGAMSDREAERRLLLEVDDEMQGTSSAAEDGEIVDGDDLDGEEEPQERLVLHRRSHSVGSALFERRRRSPSILSRWDERHAQDMIVTMERQAREAELLALAGLHAVSMLDASFLQVQESPPPRPGAGAEARPERRSPSSLFQMWRELETERDGGRDRIQSTPPRDDQSTSVIDVRAETAPVYTPQPVDINRDGEVLHISDTGLSLDTAVEPMQLVSEGQATVEDPGEQLQSELTVEEGRRAEAESQGRTAGVGLEGDAMGTVTDHMGILDQTPEPVVEELLEQTSLRGTDSQRQGTNVDQVQPLLEQQMVDMRDMLPGSSGRSSWNRSEGQRRAMVEMENGLNLSEEQRESVQRRGMEMSENFGTGVRRMVEAFMRERGEVVRERDIHREQRGFARNRIIEQEARREPQHGEEDLNATSEATITAPVVNRGQSSGRMRPRRAISEGGEIHGVVEGHDRLWTSHMESNGEEGERDWLDAVRARERAREARAAAVMDVLLRSSEERRSELEGLSENRVVSDFAFRNRLQSFFRRRFLAPTSSGREEQEQPRVESVAAPELGRLRERRSVSSLREGFRNRLESILISQQRDRTGQAVAASVNNLYNTHIAGVAQSTTSYAGGGPSGAAISADPISQEMSALASINSQGGASSVNTAVLQDQLILVGRQVSGSETATDEQIQSNVIELAEARRGQQSRRVAFSGSGESLMQAAAAPAAQGGRAGRERQGRGAMRGVLRNWEAASRGLHSTRRRSWEREEDNMEIRELLNRRSVTSILSSEFSNRLSELILSFRMNHHVILPQQQQGTAQQPQEAQAEAQNGEDPRPPPPAPPPPPPGWPGQAAPPPMPPRAWNSRSRSLDPLASLISPLRSS